MNYFSRDLHPFAQLLVLLLFCLAGLLIGNVVAMALLSGVYEMSLTDLAAALNNPEGFPEVRGAVVLYQAIVSGFAFVGGPLLLMALKGVPLGPYLSPNRVVPALLLLVPLLMIAFMPANSVVIEWNSRLDLPDLMGFEGWARAQEEKLRRLTAYLTEFTSAADALVGVLVFAVIPALGEELTFRGVVQRQLSRWMGNTHVAIWVAAIIFSAIHMQFLGFLPRMLLGALLGYLYFWSGNIWVPILGHFVNNAFTVLMIYLRQIRVTDYEIESTQSMPVAMVVASVLATAGLIYAVKRESRKSRFVFPEEQVREI